MTLAATITPQSCASSSTPSLGLTISSGGISTGTVNSTSLTIPSPPASSTPLATQPSPSTAYSKPVQNPSFETSISVSPKGSPNSMAATTTTTGELSVYEFLPLTMSNVLDNVHQAPRLLFRASTRRLAPKASFLIPPSQQLTRVQLCPSLFFLNLLVPTQQPKYHRMLQ